MKKTTGIYTNSGRPFKTNVNVPPWKGPTKRAMKAYATAIDKAILKNDAKQLAATENPKGYIAAKLLDLPPERLAAVKAEAKVLIQANQITKLKEDLKLMKEAYRSTYRAYQDAARVKTKAQQMLRRIHVMVTNNGFA